MCLYGKLQSCGKWFKNRQQKCKYLDKDNKWLEHCGKLECRRGNNLGISGER